jgi:DNA invertase Pin-like site-specific DNA recombinase
MQLEALKKTGCKRIFTDKLSGAQVERPGLKGALSHLREADTLVVWKLDRLGRSVKGLVDLVNELETQKVHFQSITDGIDTKTAAGRFFFHVMASLAQMERELIVERTRAGLHAARHQDEERNRVIKSFHEEVSSRIGRSLSRTKMPTAMRPSSSARSWVSGSISTQSTTTPGEILCQRSRVCPRKS